MLLNAREMDEKPSKKSLCSLKAEKKKKDENWQ
jgi:hypothetical protein